MVTLLLTAMSVMLLMLAVFWRVPAQQRQSDPIGPPPPLRPEPVAPPPPLATPVAARPETVADLAADFAWKNNQTVFVIFHRNTARTLAVTVGPPGRV